MMDNNPAACGTLVASALFVGALVWITRGGRSIDQSSQAAAADDTAETQDSQGETSGSTEEQSERTTELLGPIAAPTSSGLRNVFSVKQDPIIHNSDTKSDGAKLAKPFSSSYYFAHNTHSIGGGYKDGLKASDYQMGTPRLLSKGGVAVVDKEQDEESDTVNSNDGSDGSDKPAPQTRRIPTRQISKYLWDDGESVAKIHIESLPKSSTECISWEKANINRNMVHANLVGEGNSGLSLSITTDEARYTLIAPQMYGSADKVSFVVKKHKLLVKIAKAKTLKRQTTSGLWAKLGFASNENEFVSVPWPRLTSSSAGGVSGSVDIDEKLFKSLGGDTD